MASGPIIPWQIEGGKVEAVMLFSWAPKSLQTMTIATKLKDNLPLGRKAMTNLHRVLKIRDITLSTKVWIVKAMVFPAVTYGRESWTMKNAEH